MTESGLLGLASNIELGWGLVLRAVGIIALYYVCKFFVRLYQVRTNIRTISKKHGVVRPRNDLKSCFRASTNLSRPCSPIPFFGAISRSWAP